MIQTKKLIYGGQKGLHSAISKYEKMGWKVESMETAPRGNTNRQIYIANLKREK